MASSEAKVVIITGASSGIGWGTALKFAKEQYRLVLVGRNKANLEDIASKCLIHGISNDSIFTLEANVTEDKALKMVVEKTVEKFGRIDVLVNSAGILGYGSVENHDISKYDEVFNVNTRACFILSQLCTPFLIQTKGNIVNVSSVNGLRSFPNVLAYCMSKAAVDQFTRCAAIELAPKQVRVNAVNPGVIVTEAHKRAGLDEESYQKFLERSKTTHALGRVGNVDEVAETIFFLASEKASYITGATIPVDGGRHALCPR